MVHELPVTADSCHMVSRHHRNLARIVVKKGRDHHLVIGARAGRIGVKTWFRGGRVSLEACWMCGGVEELFICRGSGAGVRRRMVSHGKMRTTASHLWARCCRNRSMRTRGTLSVVFLHERWLQGRQHAMIRVRRGGTVAYHGRNSGGVGGGGLRSERMMEGRMRSDALRSLAVVEVF